MNKENSNSAKEDVFNAARAYNDERLRNGTFPKMAYTMLERNSSCKAEMASEGIRKGARSLARFM